VKYRPSVIWLYVFLSALTLLASEAFAAGSPLAASENLGLWVGGEKFISEFQRAALKRNGDPRPALAFTTGQWSDPLAMTFDKEGDLWMTFSVINDNLPGSPIIKLTPANISALVNRNTKPAVVLRNLNNDQMSFLDQGALAFDSAENLWVSDGHRIMEFPRKVVKQSGEPTATVVISSDDMAVQQIRFDSEQNLWAVVVYCSRIRVPALSVCARRKR